MTLAKLELVNNYDACKNGSLVTMTLAKMELVIMTLSKMKLITMTLAKMELAKRTQSLLY